MPSIMPHSELVRKAMDYIALEIKKKQQGQGLEGASKLDNAFKYKLVEEACLKFDLSPKDASSLHHLLEDELDKA